MRTWLNPLTWLRWSGQFLRKWFLTMPRSSVGTAMPSLIAGAVLLAVTGLALMRDSDWRTQRIHGALRDAIARSDHAETKLLCRRLLRRDPQDRKLQFQLAVARSYGEDRPLAIEAMRHLAHDEQYAPAAAWLLDEEYTPVAWDEWDATRRGQFGTLLEVAISDKAAGRRWTSWYADYLVATEATEKALPYLQQLIDQQPTRALQAAIIQRQSGNETQAEATAQQGLRRLQQRGVEEPMNVELYLAQTRLMLFLHRYEEAARLLKTGLELTKDARLRQAAAETLVIWSHNRPETKDETVQLAQRLTLLRQAVQLAPENPLVLDSLIPLVLETATDESPRVAQVRTLLVNGVAPELGHFIRGTAATLNGDIEQAMFHLELAAEQMPQSASVLNNLAVTMASRESADLAKALDLVDAAIQQAPNEPYFHETRGQILLKMERYRDAIPALERALPAKKLALPIHRSLATAYRQLGKEAIAGEHDRLAKLAEPTAGKGG